MPSDLKNEQSDAVSELREERKTTGRVIAVIVALILIIIASYHAWIRKTAVLAGVLVPALIMVLYGGWVVFLTKRDKKRRMLRQRQILESGESEILMQDKNEQAPQSTIQLKSENEAMKKSSQNDDSRKNKRKNRKIRRHARKILFTTDKSDILAKKRQHASLFRTLSAP